MKVNQTGNSPVQKNEATSSKTPVRNSQTPDAKKSAAKAPSDVEISSKAKDLAKAKTLASEAPDVREEKVSELKRKISEGKYRVDANAVADRLVDEHLKMPV